MSTLGRRVPQRLRWRSRQQIVDKGVETQTYLTDTHRGERAAAVRKRQQLRNDQGCGEHEVPQRCADDRQSEASKRIGFFGNRYLANFRMTPNFSIRHKLGVKLGIEPPPRWRRTPDSINATDLQAPCSSIETTGPL